MTFHESQKPIVTHRGKVENKAPQHYENSNKTTSTIQAEPIPSPVNTKSLIEELGENFKLIKLTKNQDIIERWEGHLPLLNQLIQRISTNPIPEDIQTLKTFIAQARNDIDDTKHERSQYIYEKKLKTKFESFGTITPSEWDVVSFYSIDPKRESMKSCGLCGHAIQNVYTIQKLTEPNKGKELGIGSECVVNYLDIPINKVDFDLKFNPDKQFVSKINELNSLINELVSKNNPDWGTRAHYEKRKELIDKYTEKFKKDQFLTNSQAEKVLEELTHATEDMKRIRSDIQAKRDSHDVLKTLMESSIPFHDQNSFLKDIYRQWQQNDRTLSERQIEAFKNTLSRYLNTTPLAEESEGEHEVEGIITDMRITSVNTSRGSKEKIIFTVGNISDISIVEWTKGYNIIKELYQKIQVDDIKQLFHIKYKTNGRYRNVMDNGIQIIASEEISDIPKTDLSVFAPIIPRKWQRNCFDKWWDMKVGTVQAGTGSGKTILGLMAVKKLLHEKPNGTVIISVPTTVLQRQWYGELTKFGINENMINLVGGDGEQNTFGQITIGIVNSLRNRELKADLYISDEAHHTSDIAQQNFTVWDKQPFERMLFITATAGRIGEQIPIICNVSQDELQDEGAIVRYSVTNISVELTRADYVHYEELTEEAQRAGMMASNWGKKILGDRYRFITNHPLKVTTAVNLIKSIKFEKAIVFFTTINSVDYFHDIMIKEGIPSSKIHSKMNKEDGIKNMQYFAEGKTRVLIGAFSISEGINVPDADLVILVGGNSEERQFIQRIGRVLRIAKDKESAQVYQIYVKDTMEQGWIKKRMLSVAKSTIIKNE